MEYEHKYNKKRLYYGVKAFLAQFYKGDGMYGDGDSFNMDYYNSFVIHPMLFDTIRIMSKHSLEGSEKFSKKELPRLKRFAEIQERMISPEGAYPVLGRTLSCRFGAFHALAHAALSRCLPQSVSSGQVRCALNAVLNRHMKMGMNFDENFFLTIGFNGKQDNMAETYVSSGSPYHCTAIFLPLGLAETDVFWTERDSEWTSLKAFNGLEFDADHAFHEIRVKEKTMHNLVFVYHVIKKKFNL